MATLLTKSIRCVFKREFYTLSSGCAKAIVLTASKTGVIFTHRQIQVSLQKYGLQAGSILYISLEKASENIQEYDLIGKQIEFSWYRDWIGLPTKGPIENPIYLDRLRVVDEEEKLD